MSDFPWTREMPNDLAEPVISDTAKMIYDRRYRWKDENNNFQEDYKQMFWRIAWNVAQAEKEFTQSSQPGHDYLYWAKKFYSIMARGYFLPNSPTIANAGREKTCLSACFVLPIADSMEGIYTSVMENALVQKNGGGVGTDFSPLRPKGAYIKGTGGTSSGPVSFMRVINYSTDSVKQGALRRGANMGMLSVHHPDIMEFIDCKAILMDDNVKLFVKYAETVLQQHGNTYTNLIDKLSEMCDWQGNVKKDYMIIYYDILNKVDECTKSLLVNYTRSLLDTQFKNFNISVAVTDEFMQAVVSDSWYNLYIDPYGERKLAGKLKARAVWDKIVYNAWRNGEPGIVFIDTINAANPLRDTKITCTNPCGEIPLLPYESCNLGSINVSSFYDAIRAHAYGIDKVYELEDVVRTAVRFLDNVIEINNYPLPQIQEATKANRRIGLGVMGLADLLIMCALAYDSNSGRDFVSQLFKNIYDWADSASRNLAKERGNFPNWHMSTYAQDGTPRRNVTLLTCAPTGTISMLADCSSGIEPLFGLTYTKTVMDGTAIHMVNRSVEKFLHNRCGIDPQIAKPYMVKGYITEHDVDQIVEKTISQKTSDPARTVNIPTNIEYVKRLILDVLKVANEIAPEDHVRMQQLIQQYVDNSISKTINFSNDATVDDVRNAYMKAWEWGCKGITVYRDGSRNIQILTTPGSDQKRDNIAINSTINGYIPIRNREKVTYGRTEKVKIGCGKLYVTVNKDKYGLCEAFVTTGKFGGCKSQSEATCRLISLCLRGGINPAEVIDQLKDIRCEACKGLHDIDGATIKSCPDAIAKMLERTAEETVSQGVIEDTAIAAESILETSEVCPECGLHMNREGGCKICPNCGFSRCG